MTEQTIWIAPRATLFTDVCQACEAELPDGRPWATVKGSLTLNQSVGRAVCARGHTMRVLRTRTPMPAAALR